MPKKEWEARASKLLKGKTVERVRYLGDAEMEDLMWEASSLVIFFTDGTYIYASRDDEGNGPGALFTSSDDLPTIPVI